ncbi:MAG: DNA gyrase inhibitor YacG [Beijerinckiaceae bacterium]|jgi:endogenous inhibitor of DNA gyrase (YacG/DUF329 family)
MTDKGETGKACPICGKPSVQPFAPFCSKRCADIDLGRWLKGVYSIPVSEAEDSGEGEMADERQDEKD